MVIEGESRQRLAEAENICLKAQGLSGKRAVARKRRRALPGGDVKIGGDAFDLMRVCDESFDGHLSAASWTN